MHQRTWRKGKRKRKERREEGRKVVEITRQRQRRKDKGRKETRGEGVKEIKQLRKTDKSLFSYLGHEVDGKWRWWRWNCNRGWYETQLSLLVHFIIRAQVLLCSHYVSVEKRCQSVGFIPSSLCVCVLFSPDRLAGIKRKRQDQLSQSGFQTLSAFYRCRVATFSPGSQQPRSIFCMHWLKLVLTNL